jgi:hypothetical protein
MEYPFGFGFELMSNPRAMERFFSMDDKQKRELMRAIAAIRTREEIRGFLAGITAELPPSERKTP